ncbi:hypothetical protein PoB_005375500 [Plakobranchus ocellatus]|uniref:Uncharacterized protein n=1 Tax=Plakobranchus ocellatus TaxID=259542 RepID=A0AAV4C3K2_9GAST|nr:hypothetical protein PoB_005375500 [Plakobranchus ocellatus]
MELYRQAFILYLIHSTLKWSAIDYCGQLSSHRSKWLAIHESESSELVSKGVTGFVAALCNAPLEINIMLEVCWDRKVKDDSGDR